MTKQTYEPMGGIQIQITILGLVSTAYSFQFLPAPSWRSKEGWDTLCDSIPRVVPQYWVECYSVLERSWLIKFDSYKAEAFLPSINWYVFPQILDRRLMKHNWDSHREKECGNGNLPMPIYLAFSPSYYINWKTYSAFVSSWYVSFTKLETMNLFFLVLPCTLLSLVKSIEKVWLLTLKMAAMPPG